MRKNIITIVSLFVLTLFCLTGCGGGGSSSQPQNPPPVAATVPDPPTNVVAVAGNGQITVSFTAPASDGGSAITGYVVTASGGQTATGTTSPITVIVPNSVAYTCTVKAINAVGASAPSAVSNSVTPITAVPPVPPVPSAKFSIDGTVWNITKSGSEFFVAMEKNRSITIAKYDALGNKILEAPIQTAATASDSFYCTKLLAPTFDSTFLYAFCTKEDVQFAGLGFRTRGEVRMLKVRKDTLAIADTMVLFPSGNLSAVEMFPSDTSFFVLNTVPTSTAQFLINFDFAGTDLGTQSVVKAVSLQVGSDAVYVGGMRVKPLTSSFDRLSVKKFPKNLGTAAWETHYRNFDDSTDVDSTDSKMLTLSASGLFMTGTLDALGFLTTPPSPNLPQNVMIRWDLATGATSLIKSAGSTTNFGKIVSDATSTYAVLGNTICKIAPDGTTLRQTGNISGLNVKEMLIDGTSLLVSSAGTNRILVFDTGTLAQTN